MEEVKDFQGVFSKMAVLYTDGQAFLESVSDITLVVGYREYQLHKIFLCAASPVFTEMCSHGKPIKEKVPLDETEERAAVFEEFIKYLYTGDITLKLETVNAIIELADKYEVQTLKKIAKKFRKKHTPGTIFFNHFYNETSSFYFYRPQSPDFGRWEWFNFLSRH